MSARHILIVYGSTYGQTAKVAARMAGHLAEAGDIVALEDAGEPTPGLAPRDFDAVIVGSSVTYERHQRSVRRFVRAHLDALNAMPSAFFSVSGAAGSPEPAGLIKAVGYVDRFLQETGWRPMFRESSDGLHQIQSRLAMDAQADRPQVGRADRYHARPRVHGLGAGEGVRRVVRDDGSSRGLHRNDAGISTPRCSCSPNELGCAFVSEARTTA
jgi:menaquinone-dependent protoporphyrinogen IX oxidase